MNAHEFDVAENRHFITLTERGSNRAFRIPVSDAIVVSLSGPNWRNGDVIVLSEQQQKTLEKLDGRCREMGDEAAMRETKLQNQLGGLSWIVLILVIVLIVLWIKK